MVTVTSNDTVYPIVSHTVGFGATTGMFDDMMLNGDLLYRPITQCSWTEHIVHEDACGENAVQADELIERVTITKPCIEVYVNSQGGSGLLNGPALETGKGTQEKPYVNLNSVTNGCLYKYWHAHCCNFPMIRVNVSGVVDYRVLCNLGRGDLLLDFTGAVLIGGANMAGHSLLNAISGDKHIWSNIHASVSNETQATYILNGNQTNTILNNSVFTFLSSGDKSKVAGLNVGKFLLADNVTVNGVSYGGGNVIVASTIKGYDVLLSIQEPDGNDLHVTGAECYCVEGADVSLTIAGATVARSSVLGVGASYGAKGVSVGLNGTVSTATGIGSPNTNLCNVEFNGTGKVTGIFSLSRYVDGAGVFDSGVDITFVESSLPCSALGIDAAHKVSDSNVSIVSSAVPGYNVGIGYAYVGIIGCLHIADSGVSIMGKHAPRVAGIYQYQSGDGGAGWDNILLMCEATDVTVDIDVTGDAGEGYGRDIVGMMVNYVDGAEITINCDCDITAVDGIYGKQMSNITLDINVSAAFTRGLVADGEDGFIDGGSVNITDGALSSVLIGGHSILGARAHVASDLDITLSAVDKCARVYRGEYFSNCNFAGSLLASVDGSGFTKQQIIGVANPKSAVGSTVSVSMNSTEVWKRCYSQGGWSSWTQTTDNHALGCLFTGSYDSGVASDLDVSSSGLAFGRVSENIEYEYNFTMHELPYAANNYCVITCGNCPRDII